MFNVIMSLDIDFYNSRIFNRKQFMDFLRQLVGGPKNRYKQNGFNLDLTYISSRIVAMAYPASGIEKLYRNSIDTIAQFLQKRHRNKYITINISGRHIEDNVLQNVEHYQWEDHKTPSFETLFEICDRVSRFLAEDPQRIAVFHCNHGKGRTGTIICCFFLFMGAYTQTTDIMKFYGQQRFQQQGSGVTQPCQKQYISYFQRYLYKQDCYPQILSIKKVTFKGGYQFTQPYLKLINNQTKQVLYNTHENNNALVIDKNYEYSIIFSKKNCFIGDMTLQIKENRVVGKNLVISYIFNTGFIDTSNPSSKIVKLEQLSPLGKQKQKNFDSSFYLEIQFRKPCDCSDSRRLQGCHVCKGILKREYEKWLHIKTSCKNRELLWNRKDQICFGVDQKHI